MNAITGRVAFVADVGDDVPLHDVGEEPTAVETLHAFTVVVQKLVTPVVGDLKVEDLAGQALPENIMDRLVGIASVAERLQRSSDSFWDLKRWARDGRYGEHPQLAEVRSAVAAVLHALALLEREIAALCVCDRREAALIDRAVDALIQGRATVDPDLRTVLLRKLAR